MFNQKTHTTKGYIFDFGGTLDTAGCHWGKMLWHAYERQHVPVSEEQFREAYVYAERTLGKHPIIQPDYSFRKMLEVKIRIEFDYLQEQGYINLGNFLQSSMQAAVLNDLYDRVKSITAHSLDVLEKVKQHGPMILVSNFYGNMNVVLREFHLNQLFETIIESAVVGVRKPNPAIYQMGVEALGLLPSEVTVVGDSLTKDMVPAKMIGCKTVWIKGEGWTDDACDVTSVDCVIKDLSELLTT